ncbi:hypothetical protein J2751_001852 [Halorubrum alkaliphilum]|uniref:Uncharacterized protein n=1 Tax=Halorubrum alkaliphilum TaxID=261290 RepID=A0A8T4GF89_9EURY|nr:DUF6276 family protein [Halorubrum alkaliphilum]MBP1922836.1 hypothetical protein [Halorubrum alkaliphilum]
MACPYCASSVVAFAVPPGIREHAPAPETVICTVCLRTVPAVDAGVDPAGSADGVVEPMDVGVGSPVPDFSPVDPAFPDGEAGVALALLCGSLVSFALNRSSIEALVEHAERSGADVFSFLERLDAADAAFDLDRRRAALLDLC